MWFILSAEGVRVANFNWHKAVAFGLALNNSRNRIDLFRPTAYSLQPTAYGLFTRTLTADG